jgi:hypothetical protein
MPILAATLMLATAVQAQQGLRETDRAYGQAELSAMLADFAVEFHDGSVSRYRGDGMYSFKYTDSDRPYIGTYEVRDAGQVCIAFASGDTRCDTFVADGTRMVLVIADGNRFPVRERRALVDGY